MRSFSALFTLALASSVMAAPFSGQAALIPVVESIPTIPQASFPEIAHNVLDVLTSSASKLSTKIINLLPSTQVHSDDEEEQEFNDAAVYYGAYGTYEDEVTAWENRHSQCAEVCRVKKIEGVSSGKDALCSADGLESTLNCAQCIDLAWPEDEFENSAMSEYARIVSMCQTSA